MRAKKKIDFPYAIRSFLGYLEGTEKSLHTIKNYRLDLLSFQSFLEAYRGPRSLAELTADDLEHYHAHMRSHGLKTNTRRRRLMTLRRFLSYLALRKKLPIDLGKTLPTPYKLERIPVTVPASELLRAIRAYPGGSELSLRNRTLCRTLLETGCLISEAAKIRWNDWSEPKAGSAWVEITGKNSRRVSVSDELHEWVHELKKLNGSSKAAATWVFQGFNKFGSQGNGISPRGIEVLVKSCAAQLGFPDLIPRTFRHSAVLGWFQQGMSEKEIQTRLGLKSDYAFRAFSALRK
jgi:site-specific recombinase XerD